jgi:phytoene dehydrogenase-like protein
LSKRYEYDAVVVGGGPNGLAAAIRLAQHGLSTVVLESSQRVGGGCRTEELTLPGFWHDVGSAVHPLAVGSPFFSSLPLGKYGLSWIHPEIPLAHPVNRDEVAVLRRSITETAGVLRGDAGAYRKLYEPLVLRWESLLAEVLQPPIHLPRHPRAIARFGSLALHSIEQLVQDRFSQPAGKALLAGLGAHSFLPLNAPGSAAFAIVLGILGHAVGWPIPRGGAQAITEALCQHLDALGGKIQTEVTITSLRELPPSPVVLFNVTPRQFTRIAGDRLPIRYRRALERFKYGPGVFKIDYALDGPLPWHHEWCAKAGTIHLGGTYEEIAQAESQVAQGREPDRPFLLVSQPTLFDPSRAPAGGQIVWLYTHVPSGSKRDVTELIEKQLARFAPGFRERVLSRHVTSPADLERLNPNLVGGSITGGDNSLWQLIARPTLSRVPYRTALRGVYLCSSSTPPGGGVHGMCGFHAANAAWKDLHRTAR